MLVLVRTVLIHRRNTLDLDLATPLVDDGNYGFTRVTHNTIITGGSMIKIGVGQG